MGELIKHGDGVDFDEHVFGKADDLYGGAGWRGFRERFGVDCVHGGEVVHVFEEDGGFYDVAEIRAASRQDGFQIFQHLPGLRFNPVRNRAGGWMERDLPGAIERIADLDGLRIGADRRGGA